MDPRWPRVPTIKNDLNVYGLVLQLRPCKTKLPVPWLVGAEARSMANSCVSHSLK